MLAPEMKPLKLLEDENSRLKRIVADLSLDNDRIDNANEYLFENGTQFIFITAASNAVPTVNFFVLAFNPDGTAGNFTGDQLASASIGGGLSTAEQGNLSSRINAYMTSVGANVY